VNQVIQFVIRYRTICWYLENKKKRRKEKESGQKTKMKTRLKSRRRNLVFGIMIDWLFTHIRLFYHRDASVQFGGSI
jgi:nicotinamide riboside transporter PnuC